MSKTAFTVGRDPSTDIPVADRSVSRVHAEVSLIETGGILVTDRQSSNGTFVIRNGVETRIEQERVGPEDSVKFGSVTLTATALATAILRKMGAVAPGRAPAKGPPKPPRFGEQARLVRCPCGDIKKEGGSCPSCGD